MSTGDKVCDRYNECKRNSKVHAHVYRYRIKKENKNERYARDKRIKDIGVYIRNIIDRESPVNHYIQHAN